MINVTRLLGLGEFSGDSLRYSQAAHGAKAGARLDSGPVVVWNCTRACNLACQHCYAGATPGPAPDELTHAEGLQLVKSLASFRVPVLLLSGGEPLVRPGSLDLVQSALSEGMGVTISTNGTLIDRSLAKRLKGMGVNYVGISLDGLEATHDQMRGQPGAFAAALEGVRHCLAAGVKVGLRLTLTRANFPQLPDIFYLLAEERIPRACFYHLVYCGRGQTLKDVDLTPADKRAALDIIIDRTAQLHARGRPVEVLTVDNHADGPYLYLKLKQKNPVLAGAALDLLKLNGGNRSGLAIAAVDWLGNVHPDQFSLEQIVGNVRERDFGAIWSDDRHSLLRDLRQREAKLPDRCRACNWLSICNGNSRSRAYFAGGDFWGFDPGCYLTSSETRRVS